MKNHVIWFTEDTTNGFSMERKGAPKCHSYNRSGNSSHNATTQTRAPSSGLKGKNNSGKGSRERSPRPRG